jgi:predicted Zn-ribbon and HTH transcriptional regulator
MEKKRRGRQPKVVQEVVNIVKDEAQELVNEIKEDVAEGLGDTLEKVFEKTGIKKLVKFIAGEDCGCDERKEKLNKLFPYRKPNCLTQDEHITLETFFVKNSEQVKPSEQVILLAIYNRVFNTRREPTNCSSCWRDIINQLKKVYNEYKDEQDANS